MRLALLGSPASGKGTQGALLAARYGVRHLSSGDLLRREVAHSTTIGRRAAGCLARGDLVPDELVFELLAGAVHDEAGGDDYILDGFPRTLHQASRAASRVASEGIALDIVVYLKLSDALARRRVGARISTGRQDDADAATTERRLQVHHRETPPVLYFYAACGTLHEVDADQSIERVTDEIVTLIAARAATPSCPASAVADSRHDHDPNHAG